MTLESIEKLRKALKDCTSVSGVEPNQFDTYWITAAACDKYIDEIEREIAERYMKLPVDCENKPIHIGDVMDEGKVAKLVISDDGEHSVYVYKLPNVQHEFYCYETAHKPRTIEDVLLDYGNEIARQGHQAGLAMGKIAAKYADELRGMGVGE